MMSKIFFEEFFSDALINIRVTLLILQNIKKIVKKFKISFKTNSISIGGFFKKKIQQLPKKE